MNALPVRSVFCFVLASSLSGIALPQERSPAGGERPLLAQAPSAMPSPSVEIRIGHVGPLSGNLSRLGRDAENGVRLALEQANAAGIRIGGKAATFVLVSQDDQANSQFAVAAAQKLVAANVAGVIGHLNSGAAVAASPTYRQAGVPVISASATTPHLTELGSRVQFRVASRDDGEGGAMANYLVSTVRPKVVAIIDDSTAYGELLADEVEASLRSNGIDVLARRKGTDKTSDWRAVLAAMQGRPPDTIVYGGMDDTGGPLVKQARELGIEARFFFGDGACRAEMSRLAGKASEGMLCVQPGIPAASAAKTFIDAYKARFNVAPIAYAPFAYDAANMLIDAMKAANSADPTKYMVELTRLSHAGATGRIAFNEKGDRKLAPFTVYAMRGGALEPIAIVPGREPATGRPGAIVEGGGAIAGERQGGGIGQEAIATSCDSGSASRSARFATKDGVATDRKTGLTWQRCSVGQRWSPGAGCAGNPKAFEWNEIGEQAANGWRVPTQRELIEIQAKGCSGAAIDAAVFPNAPAEMFWSTTVYPDGNPGFAFFGKEGGGGSAPEDLGMYLRLVRDK